jgi:hypothetical protein
MHPCPKCGSGDVHRSRTKTIWEGWRQTLTGKRMYRCRKCNWRGWGADRRSRHADGRVPSEPPNLSAVGLNRVDRRKDLDLDALDSFVFRADERT